MLRIVRVAERAGRGQATPVQRPSGNITFLFTDIERSSQLWETHPQTMGRALAQHDRLVRGAIEEFHGHVFKTVGDAFCVAFNGALDGARAAVEAQRRLAAAPWEETGPLRVRMALHSGEAEEREGDYFGTTLNRVARVLATGHGGQTLLSRATAELVADRLPADLSLRDLGERRLKDLSRPERIYQLVARDLPTEFPPLRSLELLPNNLPAQVTTFVGRGRAMAEVKRLLEGARLLTLTGPGGTGKTRLSLQVAADVLDRFPHGVWLIELANISDAASVPEVLANVLDVRIEHGRQPLETLVEALRGRNILLVVDNCEHVIAACAQVAEALLRRCPNVKILASSREALNIQGETIWSVPPLAVTEWHLLERRLPLAELSQFEAVQLFVDRAKAARPSFALTEANADQVARLCWRLDGIPLAIELAAARVKVLSLEQILARLDDRFRLLSGGSRTASPRQQTLGALIDWSYDLLSEPERILLRRLSVFVAGRTLEMAEEVCAGDGLESIEIFDQLSGLVEKSLLTIEQGFDGESRYTMLESVWDYANGKLAEHSEAAKYRRRHLDFFVRLAESAQPMLEGRDQKAWLERLHYEHYNLDTALEFAVESPETVEAGLRLAGAVARFWTVRGYFTEGYGHLTALLARADEKVSPAVRAKGEWSAGLICWSQDRDADAQRHYGEARRLYTALGARLELGRVEALLGYTKRNDGRPDEAQGHFETALALGKEAGSDEIVARALNGMGSVAMDRGDFVAARELKERALGLFRKLGDLWVVALITGSMGRMYTAAGDLATARRVVTEALILHNGLGSRGAVPYGLEALADICGREGQAEKGIRLYGAASVLRESLALDYSTTERISYNSGLEELRESVSPAVFETEWMAGRALTMQAAVDYALAR